MRRGRMRLFALGRLRRSIGANLGAMWLGISSGIGATRTAKQTGMDPAAMAEEIRAEYETEQAKAREVKNSPHLRKLPDYWSPYKRGRYDASLEVDTGVPLEKLAEITDGLC